MKRSLRPPASSPEMDTDEWELLAVDGLLDFHDDGHGGRVYSRRRSCHSESVLDMDHFRCPSPPAARIVPAAIGLGPEAPPAGEGIAGSPAVEAKAPSVGGSGSGSEREGVSRPVFFKKAARDKNEFVDMTVGDAAVAERESLCSPPRMRGEREAAAAAAVKGENDAECEAGGEVLWEEKRSESNAVNNILKRGFTGIGALCSFGVAAAATFCVLILGSRQGNNNRRSQPKQNLRFQIYSDDKRIEKVVHHATKLNEAISAVRGVPHTRAHIIVGGYYDAL
ncbi:uncharacterized protein LOC104425273 [Eucalyptus grandis]|uniref:uncharacterized protein LOC104425273 n=1 Tax=Eucalyptus grandis TaxID=71139 RepID=UPI00192ED913|nr:uncharacterized protein LOC104425273 [Eucalyptus grandis]